MALLLIAIPNLRLRRLRQWVEQRWVAVAAVPRRVKGCALRGFIRLGRVRQHNRAHGVGIDQKRFGGNGPSSVKFRTGGAWHRAGGSAVGSHVNFRFPPRAGLVLVFIRHDAAPCGSGSVDADRGAEGFADRPVQHEVGDRVEAGRLAVDDDQGGAVAIGELRKTGRRIDDE